VNFKALLASLVIASLTFMLGSGNAVAQTCRWVGTSPGCDGECGDNETEMTRLGAIPPHWEPPLVNQNPPFGINCVTGTKALCCSTPGRTCRWDGDAPLCGGECRAGEIQTTPPEGSSSGAGCWFGTRKVYCCRVTSNPNPHKPVRSGLEEQPLPSPVPSTPPAAPTGCRVAEASSARCGFISIECDHPLPVADEILIGGGNSGIGIRVYRVVSDIGLVNAEYSNEGAAELTVCAKNQGGVTCSNRFAATLGSTSCPHPPAHRICPSGSRPCGSKCIGPGERCNHEQ